MEQLSEEWFAARRGKVTASRLGDLMATTRTGYGAGRGNYMAELLAERLTGKTTERFQNDAMRWGVETEPHARAAYEFFRDATVVPAEFVPHPTMANTGASPDGLIGADGMVEIKCPLTATHVDTLLTETVALKYVYQMQWQLECTGRAWCDFVSFDPRLPPKMQLYVKRFERNTQTIAELTKAIALFLRELDQKIEALKERFP